MSYSLIIVLASGGLVALSVLVARLASPPQDHLFPASSDDPFTQLNKLGASRHGYYRDAEGRWWKKSAVFNPQAGQWFKLEERV